MAIEEKEDHLSPEHVSEYQPDLSLQKQKERIRKLARDLRKSGKAPEPIIITESGDLKRASELTYNEQQHEIVKCLGGPIYFIETYLTVFDQTQGDGGEIVPFKLFSFQKELIESYLAERFIVANKYRQAGVSTTTCAYIAWYVMFKRNRSVAIVADKLETARDELMNDVVDFIDNCPAWLRPRPDVKDTQKLKRYDNGCQLSAFSSKGLRGYTPTLLFWDETAWTEKADRFWTSAKPTLQTGGRAIFVSTPNGLDPVFYKTFDAARKGDSTFVAVEIWWYNDPRYNESLEWLKNKGKENEIRMVDEDWEEKHRIKLMDDGWEATSPWFEDEIKSANGDMRKIAQEILCSFLGSGDNFIAEEYIKEIEDKQVSVPLRQAFTDLNMWVWEEPIPGEEYIMAIDASPGHGEDSSTINLLKVNHIIEEVLHSQNGVMKKVKHRKTKSLQVAEYYGKVTPQMLAEIAYQFGKNYNFAYAIVDITGGYGIQTVEKLFEYGYPEEAIHFAEVTHKPSRDMLQGYIKKGQKIMPDGSIISVDLIPGFFIGNNRGSIVLEFQRAVHMKDVYINSVRLVSEMKTFVTVGGSRVADHKRTFHDDSIMGMALGLYVLNYDMTRFQQNKGATKKMLDAMLLANDPAVMEERRLKEEAEEGKPPKPISPNKATNPDLQKHLANEWLFKGIKQK